MLSTHFLQCNHEIKCNTSLIHQLYQREQLSLNLSRRLFDGRITFILQWRKIYVCFIIQRSGFFSCFQERNQKENITLLKSIKSSFKRNSFKTTSTLENAVFIHIHAMREIEGGCRQGVSHVSLKSVTRYLYCIHKKRSAQ